MTNLRTLTLIATLALFSCGRQVVESDLFIAGASVIDVEAGLVLGPRDVLVRSGEIVTIEEKGKLSPSADTEVLDASGTYLLPGLIDVHAHIGNGGLAENTTADREQALEQFLRYGVTTIFVPGGGGGNDEQLRQWKDACDSGRLNCPGIFGSGNIITAYGSHPITTIWGLPADADPTLIHEKGATALKENGTVAPLIAQKLASGVDALKIVVDDGPGAFAPKPRLPLDQITDICKTAHEKGLRVFAHVSLAAHVDDVVEAGCDGIMHSPDDAISGETLKAMAERGVYYVATLSLFDALIDQELGNRVQEPFAMSGVSHKALASLEDEAYWSISPESPEIVAEWQTTLKRNLKRANELGVPIALGTDTNNPQIFPGYAVHEELALMVAAGLSAADALRSATVTAADFLEQSDSIGKLESGYRADIIALRDNPLEAITNTRSIEFVVANGRLVGAVISN